MDDLDEIPDLMTGEVTQNPNTLVYGQYITPEQRISLYSAEEYEHFILSWVTLILKKKYKKVLRVKKLGGAGDYGRDVVAIVDESGKWNNYQCKHYPHRLQPSDVWKEIGKILYYAKEGNITLPQEYYFVAPQGIGTTLSDLLENPTELRDKLVENWQKHCYKTIKKGTVKLENDLLQYINEVDFTIFKSLSPSEVLEEYKSTSEFITRFGGGLPNRPKVPAPTSAQYDISRTYIKELIKVYKSETGSDLKTIEDLKEYPKYFRHFERQVRHFYEAEYLKMYVRDYISEHEAVFDDFLNDVFDAIIEDLDSNTGSGFIRLSNALTVSTALPFNGHALRDCIKPGDKKGGCHQLADEGRVRWVRD